MQAHNNAAQTEIQATVSAHYREEMARGDRFILYLLAVHFVAAFTLVPIGFGTFGLGFIGGLLLTAVAFIAFYFQKGTLACRLTMGILMMAFSALFIQQTQGQLETHFHIFGGLAFLLIYKDWRVIVVAILAVALHHALFSYLQSQSIVIANHPIVVFNYGCGWAIVILHAVWVIFEGAILVYYAIQLQHQFNKSSLFAKQMIYLAGHSDLTNFVFQAANDKDPQEAALLKVVNGFFSQRSTVFQQLTSSGEVLSAESNALFDASAELNKITDKVKDQTGSVCNTIDQMTQVIETTTQTTESASEDMNQVNQATLKIEETIKRVIEKAQELNNHMSLATSNIDEFQGTMSVSSHNLAIAAEKSAQGNEFAKISGKQVQVLKESARKIGNVVGLINKIAGQTNLLALNASIESARAGESGRGFAVVAGEIKALANQTTAATGEIDAQVRSIQNETERSLSTIQETIGLMVELNQLIMELAGSSEEQARRADEISSSISQGDKATHDLSERIQRVARESSNASGSISRAAKGAQTLAKSMFDVDQMAIRMRKDVLEVARLVEKSANSASTVKSSANEMKDLARILNQTISDLNSNA